MKRLKEFFVTFVTIMMLCMTITTSVYAEIEKSDYPCTACESVFIGGWQGIDNNVFFPDWMKMLPDNVQISRINLPGTHDSGCWNMKYQMQKSTTQWLNIYQQLMRGSRFLDIRLGVFDDDQKEDPLKMELHHSGADIWFARCMCYDDNDDYLTLKTVMKQIETFLKENESETVVMCLVDHSHRKPDIQANFKKMRVTYRADRPDNKSEEYNCFRYYKVGDVVPMLGDVRGKCVIIDDADDYYTTYEDAYKEIGIKKKCERIATVMNDSPRQDFSHLTKDRFIKQSYGTEHKGDPDVKYTAIAYNGAGMTTTDYSPCESAPLINTHFANHVVYNSKDSVTWQNGKRYGWIAMDFINDRYSTNLIRNIIYSNQGTRTFRAWVTPGDGSSEYPDRKDIRLFSTTEKDPDKKYVDYEGIQIENYSGARQYSFFNLPYDDEEGNVLQYGIEVTDKQFELVPNMAKLKMEDHTPPQKSEKGSIERGYETLDYTLYHGQREMTEMLVEIELEDYEQQGTFVLQDPAEMIRQLGALKIAQKDSTGKILDYYEVYNQENVQSDIDPYFDETYGCQKIEEDVYLLKVSNLPVSAHGSEAYTYQVEGFDVYREVQEGASALNGQKISDSDEGRPHIKLIFYSTGVTKDVYGTIEWNDENDQYGLRSAAIDSLFESGLTLYANRGLPQEMSAAVEKDNFKTEGNQSEFFGTIAKYYERYGENNRLEFAVPESLSDSQYRIEELSSSDKASYSYNLWLKTALQIEFDEALMKVLADNQVQIPDLFRASVTGSDPSKAVILEAFRQGQSNIFTSKVSDVSDIQYEKQLAVDAAAVEEFLKEQKIDDYSINCSKEIIKNENGELVLQARVSCRYGTTEISGKIRWNDGGIAFDHAEALKAIQDSENTKITIDAYFADYEDVPYSGYYPVWDGEHYTMQPFENFPISGLFMPYQYYLRKVEGSVPGYSLSGTASGFDLIATRQINVYADVQVVGEGTPNIGSVKLLQNGKVIAEEKNPERKEDGSYKAVFEGYPIADKSFQRYAYSIEVVRDEDEGTLSYFAPEQSDTDGNVMADARIIYSSAGKIELPVEVQLEGKSILEQKSFRFKMEGMIDGKKYQDELSLNKENDFSGAFDIGKIVTKQGRYRFNISQITDDMGVIRYDEHISTVDVYVFYGGEDGAKLVHVEVQGEEADPKKPDTSIFVNRYAKMLITINHQAISRVSEGMRPGKGTYDYVLTTETESGEEIVLDKLTIEDNGLEMTEKCQVVFDRFVLDEAGEHTLYVSVRPHKEKGWTYDTTKYPLKITINPKNQGVPFMCDYSKLPEKGTITHYYDAVQYAIPIMLKLEGDQTKTDDTFTFTAQNIKDKKSETVMQASLKGAGTTAFDVQTYFEPCEENYLVTQIEDETNERWEYDTTMRNYQVRVTRAEDGALTLQTSDTPVFVNKKSRYPVDIQVNWKKDKKDSRNRQNLAIVLMADGHKVMDAELTSESNWTLRTEAIPHYRIEDGKRKAISYSIEVKTDITQYYEVEVTGNAAQGFVIDCTYNPPVNYRDYAVTVEWENEPDGNSRPGSVGTSLMLKAGEDESTYADLAIKADKWSNTYKDVPLNYVDEDGEIHSLTYVLAAEEVINYAAPEITVDEAGNFHVVYCYEAHVHKTSMVSAKAPNCTEDGNKEYYTCKCGVWFEDEAAEKVIEDHASVVRKAGHIMSENWSSDATGHWLECTRCSYREASAPHVSSGTATEETAEICTVCGYEIAPPLGHQHSLSKVDAVEASCTADGNIEYYTCSKCEVWFADEAAAKVIEDHDSVILKAGHIMSANWSSAAAGHWHNCTRCDYSEVAEEHVSCGAATEETAEICTVCGYEIAPPLGHQLSKVTAEEPTCTEAGNKEFYICINCGKWFADAEAEQQITDYESVIREALGHDLNERWEANATGHWHECTRCSYREASAAHVSSGTATEETAEICTVCGYEIAPPLRHQHSLSKVAAVEATCTADGNIEYYKCECGVWFADEAAAKVIEDHASVILEAGHIMSTNWSADAAGHWHKCTRCNYSEAIEGHVSSGAATCQKKAECEICHTEYGEFGEHNWSTEWTSDGKTRWHACLTEGCKEKKDTQPVIQDVILAKKVTLDKTKVTLIEKGETVVLKAVVTPENATDKSITWKSSDKKVAVVDKNGKVTAVGKGTAKITATTNNGKTATAKITVDILDVTNFLKGFKAEQKGKKLEIQWGKQKGADGYLVYAQYCGTKMGKYVKDVKSGSITKVTISELNEKALNRKVNIKVVVAAYKKVNGKKQILVKTTMGHAAGSESGYTDPKSIKVSKSNISLKKGQKTTIKASVTYTDKNKKPQMSKHVAALRYRSLDESVATVSKKGRITAKGKGTCNIFVIGSNGLASVVRVTVK